MYMGNDRNLEKMMQYNYIQSVKPEIRKYRLIDGIPDKDIALKFGVGRRLISESTGNLNVTQIKKIKKLHIDGKSVSEIALQTKVSEYTVNWMLNYIANWQLVNSDAYKKDQAEKKYNQQWYDKLLNTNRQLLVAVSTAYTTDLITVYGELWQKPEYIDRNSGNSFDLYFLGTHKSGESFVLKYKNGFYKLEYNEYHNVVDKYVKNFINETFKTNITDFQRDWKFKLENPYTKEQDQQLENLKKEIEANKYQNALEQRIRNLENAPVSQAQIEINRAYRKQQEEEYYDRIRNSDEYKSTQKWKDHFEAEKEYRAWQKMSPRERYENDTHGL